MYLPNQSRSFWPHAQGQSSEQGGITAMHSGNLPESGLSISCLGKVVLWRVLHRVCASPGETDRRSEGTGTLMVSWAVPLVPLHGSDKL